jgi:hypothetical protein
MMQANDASPSCGKGEAAPRDRDDKARRATRERDQLARLSAEIDIGMEQLARGQIVTWAADFLDSLKRESAEDVRSGRPCKDEAIP